MSSLYRKHRPRNFKETVNQNHVKITLQNQIITNSVSHAYLFCGPRGVGKTTFARLLAKAVNCENRSQADFEPCNECGICQEINKNANLDIIEIDAASHTGVDNVRENIISFARVSPSKCKYKIFIIDEVHMLSISAFNALLKILEEPPANVIFILCTTEAHKIPATIISRCQRFDFKKISVSDIVKKLEFIAKKEELKIDKKILESIARYSEGHMRDAESILGQIIAISGNEISQESADLVIPRSDINEILNLLDFLSKKDNVGSIELINKLVDDGVDLKIFNSDLIEVLRKLMIGKINQALASKIGLEYGETVELKIIEISQNLRLEEIVLFIELFIESGKKLKDSYIIQLPLEIAVTRICQDDIDKKKIPEMIVSEPSFNNIAPKQQLNSESVVIPKNSNSPKNIKINTEEITKRWNEVLAKIKKYNHSLSFILRVCQPTNLNGNRLCLAFKYKFHKDRISEQQIKNIVEKVISEVYDLPIEIEAIVDENLDINNTNHTGLNLNEKNLNNNNSDPINDLLKTFGGKIVK